MSATLSPSQTPPAPYPPQTILINELAWAGTTASSSDEWIELQNQTDSAIDLAGWRLTDDGDIKVALGGTIPAFGYFLLERTDDTTIADISADQIYTGSLVNGGERLELLDPSGAVVDTANAGGGGWPAGEAGSRRSMERRGGTD
ncbi:MAG: lamin tail domain-containing protein, partial [Chloroflexi bacterium]|nr:lamin tail domain-containing protein [Chloroflexota bacterium]